jgi:hypothetical protein
MPSNKFEEKMILCSKPQHLVLIYSCPKKNNLKNALGGPFIIMRILYKFHVFKLEEYGAISQDFFSHSLRY